MASPGPQARGGLGTWGRSGKEWGSGGERGRRPLPGAALTERPGAVGIGCSHSPSSAELRFGADLVSAVPPEAGRAPKPGGFAVAAKSQRLGGGA